jgi:putative protease
MDTPAATPTRAGGRPELLAPARDRPCVLAAVANGADAVYFGLSRGFNARTRAPSFTAEELPELVQWLHHRRVRAYVTLNTLAFPGELEEVERLIRAIALAGADAILVQDLGVARMVRAICPDLDIHASTQMTLTSADGIRAAESLGIRRVILARELSLKQIARIAGETSIELEVFVHGALCVAYSGQCMTSESLGGRSANRGECAQACRLPYELICDGRTVDLGPVKYLLSPQDLAAYDLVPSLVTLGIAGLKIEGRLKTPEYVGNITRHYRQAIDAALAGHPVEFTPRQVEEMELSFSRGFSHGWLDGNDHKVLVPGLSSAKRGVLLGHVRAVRRDRVTVELCRAVRRGDGVVFEGGRAENQEQGGRVFEVFRDGRSTSEPVLSGMVDLAFAHGAIDFGRIRPGIELWKTDDPQLTKRLRKTFQGRDSGGCTRLDLSVEAEAGRPLAITGRAESGAACRVESPGPLEEAVNHPLTADVLRQQLGRLGGTAYELRELDARITGRPMVPLSVLGRLRHAMVEALDAAAARAPTRRVAADSVLPALRADAPRSASVERISNPSYEGDEPTQPLGRIGNPSCEHRIVNPSDGEPAIHVLCRSLDQLRAVVGHGAGSVMADFQDIRQYGEAVRAARDGGAAILVAAPRIQKPGEGGIFQALVRHRPDGLLVRNLAGAAFCAERGVPFVADFSLNAANELAVAWLLGLGARRVTASYDLNREQLLELVAAAPPERLEVVIHQHMPLFHMEHCVFCALLSPGRNRTDCGRPCDRHEVRLRDRLGMEHRLAADVGCRNTLYNATPQSGAEAATALLRGGVRHFRIELLDDAPSTEIARLIDLYRGLLAGTVTGKQVWRELKAANRVGVTRGTLEERRNPAAIL